MNDPVRDFWEAMRLSRPHLFFSPEPDDIFAFGNTPEMAYRLGALVLGGVKIATTSALWAYAEGEALPQPGHYSVVLDGVGKPLCVIETTEVRHLTFAEVDVAFAHDEGEGNRTLEFWRKAHESFFSKMLPTVGRTFSHDMPVLCERFRLVYPV